MMKCNIGVNGSNEIVNIYHLQGGTAIEDEEKVCSTHLQLTGYKQYSLSIILIET